MNEIEELRKQLGQERRYIATLEQKWKDEVLAHEETKEQARQTRFALMMDNKKAWDLHGTLQDNFDKVIKELHRVKGYPQLVTLDE